MFRSLILPFEKKVGGHLNTMFSRRSNQSSKVQMPGDFKGDIEASK